MPLCNAENRVEALGEEQEGSYDFSAGEAFGKEASLSFLVLMMPLS